MLLVNDLVSKLIEWTEALEACLRRLERKLKDA